MSSDLNNNFERKKLLKENVVLEGMKDVKLKFFLEKHLPSSLGFYFFVFNLVVSKVDKLQLSDLRYCIS